MILYHDGSLHKNVILAADSG